MTRPQDEPGRQDRADNARPPSPPPMDRGGWTALSCGFAGLAFTFLLWPIGLVLGLAFDAAAIVVGVRALRRARSQRTQVPGARGGLVLGGVGIAMCLVLGSVSAVLWNGLQAYQQCLDGAITVEARQTCDQHLQTSIADRLGVPASRLEPALHLTAGLP